MGVRPERVAKELKRYISEILYTEMKDPRIGFVTIMDVELTKDLKIATVYYSIMGTKTEKNNTINALKSGTGFIKKLISENLDLRYTPDIIFREDLSAERAKNVYNILDKLKKEGEDEPTKGKGTDTEE